MGYQVNPGEYAAKWICNLSLSDDYAGQPFTLRQWQRDIVTKLFGTMTPEGQRQYRKALLLLPRKQAKTQLAAAIGVYCLLGEGKTGQTIVCAASDRNQASHLFNKSVEMIMHDKTLAKRVNVYHATKRIVCPKTGNTLFVISGDAHRAHGLNPSCVIMDELHTWKDRRLFDALNSAFGARKTPLTLMISTAGNQRSGFFWDEYAYACKVRDGIIKDDGYLPVIFEAAPDDDWRSPAVWAKAMPALGDYCELAYIEDAYRKACEVPSEETVFRQFSLNQWVASEAKFIRRECWDACGLQPLDLDSLRGRDCYAGLDLSSTIDLSSLVLVFPFPDGSYQILPYFWSPRIGAEKRERIARVPYLTWEREGFLTLTPGECIDYDFIKAKVLELSYTYHLKKLIADPFNATQVSLQLASEGMPIEFMRQGFLSMNSPTKLFEKLVIEGKLMHGSNPVLNWQADSAVIERDSSDNIKMSKKKSFEKIDGLIALVMALAGADGDANSNPSVMILD